eukprot:Opistho-1_new@99485
MAVVSRGRASSCSVKMGRSTGQSDGVGCGMSVRVHEPAAFSLSPSGAGSARSVFGDLWLRFTFSLAALSLCFITSADAARFLSALVPCCGAWRRLCAGSSLQVPLVIAALAACRSRVAAFSGRVVCVRANWQRTQRAPAGSVCDCVMYGAAFARHALVVCVGVLVYYAAAVTGITLSLLVVLRTLQKSSMKRMQ